MLPKVSDLKTQVAVLAVTSPGCCSGAPRDCVYSVSEPRPGSPGRGASPQQLARQEPVC